MVAFARKPTLWNKYEYVAIYVVCMRNMVSYYEKITTIELFANKVLGDTFGRKMDEINE
jgi:hypothetical protein